MTTLLLNIDKCVYPEPLIDTYFIQTFILGDYTVTIIYRVTHLFN